MHHLKKRVLYGFFCVVFLYLVLMIPDFSTGEQVVKASLSPFAWNNDTLWKRLENDFVNAKQLATYQLDTGIQMLKKVAEIKLDAIHTDSITNPDSSFIGIENVFFSLAPLVAVNKKELNWYIDYYTRTRNLIKFNSRNWDMQNSKTRNKCYRLLYGMRAAVEEVLLQSDSMNFSPAMLVNPEKSFTPAATILGLEVHSGDMLVSRGGAEVSALISRGNDYPGNFSHVALLYVTEKTNEAFLIEAHIEKGVAVSSVEQYEKDKKLRFMVMRPRADLPVMLADPMIPHKAALLVFNESRQRHIPYDFKMNFRDSSAMFCSEVASYAYRKFGLSLWQPVSTISSQGVVNWLQDFGVENFVTQMPSDLEYDPQLAVVEEWRDPETLFKDHIDNAVMDAMLEKANAGESIGYSSWKLPVVRIVKGYCVLKNIFGKTGIIPEGMSATRALKNQTFVAMHKRIKENTQQMATAFMRQHHYRPPYWQLVKFAKLASKDH